MKELKKEDISQEVFDLYDDYAHNKMDRKEFLQKLSLYAVGAITLPALLSFISPNYLDSIIVKPNDPRLKSEFITYDSPKGGKKIKGLFSILKDTTEKLPGIIVVHENRGLNPYIEDVGSGIIMKDTATNDCYRLRMTNGVLTSELLTVCP